MMTLEGFLTGLLDGFLRLLVTPVVPGVAVIDVALGLGLLATLFVGLRAAFRMWGKE